MSKAGLRGEVPLKVGGETYTLSFNWAHLEQYEADTGQSIFKGIQQDLDLVSNQKPLLIAASGGQITEDILKKQPLSLFETAKILREIVAVAIWGAEGPPVNEAEEEKAPEGE